jgi:hypothetical protein
MHIAYEKNVDVLLDLEDNGYMVEYVIELINGDLVVALVHRERDGRLVTVKPSVEAYMHVTKFRVKDRAQAVADKYHNARLAATYGGYVYGSKTTVAPVQSKINRRPAYKSI